jgi:hypothetical protein
MSEEKTYVFDGGSGNMLASLAPFLKGNGIDPNVLLAMNNGGMGGMNGGGWFIWILFLAFIWNRNGFGGNGDGTGFLASQLNNDYGRDVLLQAINGNANAISQLASTLNCDINAVQAALTSLGSQIQSVGNTVGLTGQQTINAIQSGNATIASQLASCCCDIKGLISTQGYENRLATLDQTQVLASKLDAQTNLINDKFCQLEMREMQNKIDALRDEKIVLQNNISQRAQNEYIATSLYPISTALTELRSDFDCFKSHLPSTISVPYSPVTAVPNCIAYQYGFGPFGPGS